MYNFALFIIYKQSKIVVVGINYLFEIKYT